MGKRILWVCVGCITAAVAGAVVSWALNGKPNFTLGVVGGPLALALGERTGRLERIECSGRLRTLFDGKIPR
jgi:hypothetical protein